MRKRHTRNGKNVWKRVLLGGTALAVLCGIAQASPGTANASAVRVQPPFLTDAQGRAVIFHGVNVVYKLSPYFPPQSQFNESDVQRLHTWGFNFVRLGILWEGLEPRPETLNGSYLDSLQALLRTFHRYGIQVLIDMHQDVYSSKYGGEGAPPWAARDDGLPYVSASGVSWTLNYFAPAVATAEDHFWKNDNHLQDAFAKVWQAVATAVRYEPNVAGYEIWNEPVQGAQTGVDFENRYLAPFYNRVIAAIRQVDPVHPIWVEPEVTFDYGIPSLLRGVHDNQLVFSFHNYSLLADAGFFAMPMPMDSLYRTFAGVASTEEKLVFENAAAARDRLHAASVLTEFGASTDVPDVGQVADLADQYMTGWAYWAYKTFNDPTGSPNEGLVNEDGTFNPDLSVLVRPYPQAVAGTPKQYGFDRKSKRFTLVYIPDTVAAGQETVLFVPLMQYPNGFHVTVRGGQVVRTDSQHLYIRNNPAATQVQVTLWPH